MFRSWSKLKSSREKVPSSRFDLSMTGMCGAIFGEGQCNGGYAAASVQLTAQRLAQTKARTVEGNRRLLAGRGSEILLARWCIEHSLRAADLTSRRRSIFSLVSPNCS